VTGKFVVVEGGEGAGKSTQVHILSSRLTSAGVNVTTTREPGGGHLGVAIRRLLLSCPDETMPPRTEALLFAADRSQHVATVIRPALAMGDVVICDRYEDSTWVYQGMARNLGPKVGEISQWAADGLTPDLVVLLDIDPRIGLVRAAGRGDINRLDSEPAEFHDRVRAGFLARAAAQHRRYLVVDGSRDESDIADQVEARVRELIRVPQVPAAAEAA
jgi:dTMP kinase